MTRSFGHEEATGAERKPMHLGQRYRDAVHCLVLCDCVIRTLEEKVASKDRRIEALEGRLAARDERIEGLEERIVRLSFELASALEQKDEQLHRFRRRVSNLENGADDDDPRASPPPPLSPLPPPPQQQLGMIVDYPQNSDSLGVDDGSERVSPPPPPSLLQQSGTIVDYTPNKRAQRQQGKEERPGLMIVNDQFSDSFARHRWWTNPRHRPRRTLSWSWSAGTEPRDNIPPPAGEADDASSSTLDGSGKDSKNSKDSMASKDVAVGSRSVARPRGERVIRAASLEAATAQKLPSKCRSSLSVPSLQDSLSTNDSFTCRRLSDLGQLLLGMGRNTDEAGGGDEGRDGNEAIQKEKTKERPLRYIQRGEELPGVVFPVSSDDCLAGLCQEASYFPSDGDGRRPHANSEWLEFVQEK